MLAYAECKKWLKSLLVKSKLHLWIENEVLQFELNLIKETAIY